MQLDGLPRYQDDERLVDGAMARRLITGFEAAAGRLPNVLVARTLAEGISIRTTLLSAMDHHPMLESNLEVRAEECIPEGTFYLMTDSDVVSTFDHIEAKREEIRSVGRQIRREGS